MYSKLYPFKTGFLSLGTMDILGSNLLEGPAIPKASRDAVSILGLYPEMPLALPCLSRQPQTSQDIGESLLGGKVVPGWNFSFPAHSC